MVKQHLKRLAVPKTWPIKKKGITFITRPRPGAHPIAEGMPLNVVFRDILGIAGTNREIKKILNSQEIMVDGKKVLDNRKLLGLMDVISIPKTEEHYRVLVNSKLNLQLVKIDEKEAMLKPCSIRNKKIVSGKVQLNLFDGRNLLVDKDTYKVGDTVVIELPGQMVKEHIKLEKGSIVYLTAGKHAGTLGTVENIEPKKITFKIKKSGSFETARKYAFVIGKAKPAIASIERISKEEESTNKTKK